MYFFCCSAGWVGQDGNPPLSSLVDAGPLNRGLCWNRCLLLQIAAAKALFQGWKAARKETQNSVIVQEATRICIKSICLSEQAF